MTEQPKDGGPAFPITDGHAVYAPGMSLRDYIAIHATEDDVRSWRQAGLPTGTFRTREEAKYAYVDAMIAAREVRHD